MNLPSPNARAAGGAWDRFALSVWFLQTPGVQDTWVPWHVDGPEIHTGIVGSLNAASAHLCFCPAERLVVTCPGDPCEVI